MPIVSITSSAPVKPPIARPSKLGVVAALKERYGDLQPRFDAALTDKLTEWFVLANVDVPFQLASWGVFNEVCSGRVSVDPGRIIICRNTARMYASDEVTKGLILKVYETVEGLRSPREQTRVYASQITDCRRKLTLALMDVERCPTGVNNPEWRLVAEFGTILHELMEGWLDEIGLSVRSEFRLGDNNWSGRADHEVELDGERYVLDVKTVGRKDFDQGANGRKFKKYGAQLSLYGQEMGLSRGIILLVCRDSGRVAEFVLDVDAERAARLREKAKDTVLRAAERRLPPAEEWSGEDGGFSCINFCPFYRLCGTIGPQEAILDTDI